jgi:cardiolipin synthase
LGWALVVFLVAGLTDLFDGLLARTLSRRTSLGAWLDPVADKLLMLFCFTALFAVHAAPAWLVFLVIARDMAIAAGWLMIRYVPLKVETGPLPAGKFSTVVQVLYILAILLILAFDINMPRLAGIFAVICGLATAASAVAYAGLFLRGVVSADRHA